LISCATRLSSIVRGLPGRTSSYSPVMRRSMNRARHLPTVCLIILSRAAIALFGSPAALASTRPARLHSAAGSERLRANDCNCARSSSLNTNSAFDLPVLIAVSPFPRYRIDMQS
jgi:hypothetical protein